MLDYVHCEFTPQTDDSHAVPLRSLRYIFAVNYSAMRTTLVRFHADYRIKPHIPPFI